MHNYKCKCYLHTSSAQIVLDGSHQAVLKVHVDSALQQ